MRALDAAQTQKAEGKDGALEKRVKLFFDKLR